MDKQCFKCRETKPTSEFYKHPSMRDGLLGKCKTCAKRDVNDRILRVRQDPVWVAKERERCRVKQNNYRALGLDAKTTKEAREKWRRNNKSKCKAENLASRAQRLGIIKKQDKCNRCGRSGCRLEKHHNDYSKPLEIEWLCSTCHGATRRKDKT